MHSYSVAGSTRLARPGFYLRRFRRPEGWHDSRGRRQSDNSSVIAAQSKDIEYFNQDDLIDEEKFSEGSAGLESATQATTDGKEGPTAAQQLVKLQKQVEKNKERSKKNKDQLKNILKMVEEQQKLIETLKTEQLLENQASGHQSQEQKQLPGQPQTGIIEQYILLLDSYRSALESERQAQVAAQAARDQAHMQQLSTLHGIISELTQLATQSITALSKPMAVPPQHTPQPPGPVAAVPQNTADPPQASPSPAQSPQTISTNYATPPPNKHQVRPAADPAQAAAHAVQVALDAVDRMDVMGEMGGYFTHQLETANTQGPLDTAPVQKTSGGNQQAASLASNTEELLARIKGAKVTPQKIPANPQGSGADTSAASPATEHGSPPTLSFGAGGGDDSAEIYWVNQLQAALLREGYFCGDDEMDDWVFGEGTQTALLTFQASTTGLTESGVTDDLTWQALLGADLQPVQPNDPDVAKSSAPGPVPGLQDFRLDQVNGVEGEETVNVKLVGTYPEVSAAVVPKNGDPVLESKGVVYDTWPTVRRDDNGPEVHALQAALQQAGYFCGDDDMRYWQFGSGTEVSLQTFQACSGLPETAVCDANTWQALLGPGSKPQDIANQKTGDSYDTDMLQDGAVFLLGEQRWERKLS